MKTLIAVLALTLSSTAFAQHHGHRWHHGHHHHRHWHPHYGWVAPMIIGGVVTYALTRPQVIVDQPPVVVQQTPPAPVQNCGPWTETQNADGTITRSRTCVQ